MLGFHLPSVVLYGIVRPSSSLILRPSPGCMETASILAQHFGAEVMVDPLLAREARQNQCWKGCFFVCLWGLHLKFKKPWFPSEFPEEAAVGTVHSSMVLWEF